jgi:hypothetical protein
MKKVINVVAAIIENEEHEILCALRSRNYKHNVLWNIPFCFF